MPHTDNTQPEFNQDQNTDCQQKTQSLSNDIENLQTALRTDFDQKLGDLANLLARFKALVITPAGDAANDSSAIDPADTAAKTNVTVFPLRHKNEQANHSAHGADTGSSADAISQPQPQDSTGATQLPANPAPASPATIRSTVNKAPVSSYSPEPARFETGLYKLNTQLYRFRLELDQEMEFREEPLHTHFHQESDLSVILQKINDKSSEKNP